METGDTERYVPVRRPSVGLEPAERDHAACVARFWPDGAEPQHAYSLWRLTRDFRVWASGSKTLSGKLKNESYHGIHSAFAFHSNWRGAAREGRNRHGARRPEAVCALLHGVPWANRSRNGTSAGPAVVRQELASRNPGLVRQKRKGPLGHAV